MIDAFSLAITLACLASAIVLGAGLLGGRCSWTRAASVLIVIELALVGQAAVDVVGLIGGHRPVDVPTHLAYLAFAVLVLPLALGQTRGDSGRWAAGYLVVALLVTGVLVIRLQTTWRSAAA